MALLMVFGAARAASAATTVVTLSFDDTLSDQAQVGPLLAARGLHATFFVNSPRIGQSGFMTLADLTGLQAAGNEIAGHTLQHFNLLGMAVDEQKRQICDDRAALLAMGFNVTSFAYPHGAADLTVHSMVTDCGYNSARDASSLRSHDPETCTSCAYAETMPPRDPLAIRTPVSIKMGMTLADMQTNVTDAETHGGGWVPFVFHHVCDGCSPNSIPAAELTAFINWLADRAATGTAVQTIQDVIGGPLNPAVTAPVATQYVAADGNLLHNASLEADLDADHVPDCWQVSSGGELATTYTSGPAPAAQDGVSAEQISVVPGMMSSPRLLSFQDFGSCSPAITPGSTFNLSAWYQSTDPSVLVAYYRTTSGWWKYWAQSPVMPAAAAYTQATWTTPAAPDEATAISVGMSLVSVGTLAVDDLVLVNTAWVASTSPDLGTTPSVPPTHDDGGCSYGGSGPNDLMSLFASLAVVLLLLGWRRSAMRA